MCRLNSCIIILKQGKCFTFDWIQHKCCHLGSFLKFLSSHDKLNWFYFLSLLRNFMYDQSEQKFYENIYHTSFYHKIRHTDYNIKCLNTVYPIYDNFLVQPIKRIFGLKSFFFYLMYEFYTSFINFVTVFSYNFCNIDLSFISKRY